MGYAHSIRSREKGGSTSTTTMSAPLVRIVFHGDEESSRLVRLCDSRDYKTVSDVVAPHAKGQVMAIVPPHAKGNVLGVKVNGQLSPVTNASQLQNALFLHGGSKPLELHYMTASPGASSPRIEKPAGIHVGRSDHPALISHYFGIDHPRTHDNTPQAKSASAVLGRRDLVVKIGRGEASTVQQTLALFTKLDRMTTPCMTYFIESMTQVKTASFVLKLLPYIARLATDPTHDGEERLRCSPDTPIDLSQVAIAAVVARRLLGLTEPKSELYSMMTNNTRYARGTWPHLDDLRCRVHTLFGYFTSVMESPSHRQVTYRRVHRATPLLTMSSLVASQAPMIVPAIIENGELDGSDYRCQVWFTNSQVASSFLNTDDPIRTRRLSLHPELLLCLDSCAPLDENGGDVLVATSVNRFFTIHPTHKHYLPAPSTDLRSVVCASIDSLRRVSSNDHFKTAHMLDVINRWVLIFESVADRNQRIACEAMPLEFHDMHFLLVLIAASIAERHIAFFSRSATLSSSMNILIPILQRVNVAELWVFMSKVNRANGPILVQLATRFISGIQQPARRVFNTTFRK